MNISTENWYVRLFWVCEMIWQKFTDDWFETNSRNTNLCTFIRTIFLLAPLAIATNLAVWGFVFYTFLYYPIHTFGIVHVGVTLGELIVASGIVAAIITGIGTWTKSKDRSADMTTYKEPGLVNMVWKYLVDSHNHVCVTINLESTKQESVL